MKRILLCNDGSAYSQVSCRYGAWLASRAGAAIDLLYLTDIRQYEIPLVADLSGSLGVQPYQDVISQLQELEKKKAGFIEEQARAELKDAGFTGEVAFHHRTGILVDCIEDFEPEVDLVLLGKRGENHNAALEHLGSNLERVIRASKKPCLVTSRKYRETRKLLFSYDGGKSGQRSLEFLVGNAALHDLEIHLAIVADDHPRDWCQDRLDWAEKELIAAGLKPQCHLLGGVVEDAISQVVSDEEIDLLVMGAYGHSRIRHLLIGSTTTAMIRDCHIPILCIR